MAEAKSDPPITPEPIKWGKVNPRRHSVAPSSSSGSAPNYLRASTGSCHDFCKYGKAHSSEPKVRNPFHKKVIRRPPQDEILVKSAVFPERMKKSPVNRPRSSPSSETSVLEAPDVLKQTGLKSDRQKPVRGDLVAEKKKTSPAAMIKPSLNSSNLLLNAKKPVKKDVVLTNEASKQILSTNKTSKKVLSTNETLKQASPKPKDRRLSGSVIVPVKSTSLPLRRLSISDSSLLRPQKRSETKAWESTGTNKKVVIKNLYAPSSASPPQKPSISERTAVNNVLRTTAGKRLTLNGISARKGKDKVKDIEVAKLSNKEEITEKTLYIVNVEETGSRTSEPVTIESIVLDVEESESKSLEAVAEKNIDENFVVDVEETETKPSVAVADKNIYESVLVNVEETEIKPLEPIADESMDESVAVNVEETEIKSLEPVADEGVDENVVVDVKETENKPLEVVANESIDESVLVDVKESESKPLEAVIEKNIDESIVVNEEEIESKPAEEVANGGIAEGDIMNVGEIESKTLEPVTNECIAESISTPLPVSESSYPLDSPPLSLQEEDETESEYTMSESEEYSASEYEESNLIQGVKVSEEGDGKTKPKKVGNHRPEDDEGEKPMKLRFRRGRIIDAQHESNTPRRLRFRRGRLLGDAQNLNPEARRMKRREQNEGESNNNEAKEGSAKVVLRHNDLQEKKDAKGLFNNVIEETASKLVETRKSKVKALVGAFETVISLQDTKPSANT